MTCTVTKTDGPPETFENAHGQNEQGVLIVYKESAAEVEMYLMPRALILYAPGTWLRCENTP